MGFNPFKAVRRAAEKVGGAAKKGAGAIASGARATRSGVSRGARAVGSGVVRGARAGGRAARDIVDISSDAFDDTKRYSRLVANRLGEGVRSIPGYGRITSAAAWLPEQTLGRAADMVRGSSKFAGLLGPAGLFLRENTDFVADLLDAPANVLKDPAGVMESAALLNMPGGIFALGDGVKGLVMDNFHEFGIVGGAYRNGLDVVSLLAPTSSLPKGVQIADSISDTLTIADILRSSQDTEQGETLNYLA